MRSEFLAVRIGHAKKKWFLTPNLIRPSYPFIACKISPRPNLTLLAWLLNLSLLVPCYFCNPNSPCYLCQAKTLIRLVIYKLVSLLILPSKTLVWHLFCITGILLILSKPKFDLLIYSLHQRLRNPIFKINSWSIYGLWSSKGGVIDYRSRTATRVARISVVVADHWQTCEYNNDLTAVSCTVDRYFWQVVIYIWKK